MLGMQEPPDEASKVIAMQVRNEDGRDAVGVEPQPIQCDEGGRPAVDQEVRIGRCHMIARLQSATGAERVTAPGNRQLHQNSPSLPRCNPFPVTPGRSNDWKPLYA